MSRKGRAVEEASPGQDKGTEKRAAKKARLNQDEGTKEDARTG